jgi:hypothetical protein
MEEQHTQDSNPQHNHAHKPRLELETQHMESATQTKLNSLTQRNYCVETESGSLRMFLESLVFCSMRLGVPFIAPRQLGAVGDQFVRPFLPSVEWCTGQSGAPPDNHCSCLVHDLLPYRAYPTVAPRGWLAHRTLSGAHRIVWCTQPAVGASHVSRVDRAADRWSLAPLAHRTVRWILATSPFSFPENDEFIADDSPDSLVHHRTVQWFIAVQLRRFPRVAGSPSAMLRP